MKRVTIVGGGLAGLSLGIGLRGRAVPVTISEAGSYPRHRVCGEFISGVRAATLEALGIADLLEGERRLQTSCWWRGEEKIHEVMLPEAAVGVSRHRLDLRLAERFEALGGELRTRERRERAGTEGLVWAAGRKVRRESAWFGLKVHVRNMATAAELEMCLGTDGYAGVAGVEDGRVNVCGLFRRQRGIGGRGLELLGNHLIANGMESLWGRIEAGDPDVRSFVGVSSFALGGQVAEDGLCVLGDAESMIPPFTGNGMSMAFEAAECALELLRRWAGGEQSWEEARKSVRVALKRRFAKRLFAARLVHPLFFNHWGRELIAASARSGVLPFRLLYRTLR